MSDSDNIKQDAVPNHHDDPAAHETESQGMVDYVKNQLSSTGSSLVDLGSKAGSMAGESVNDVKNKVGSVSPGDVYNNVRGQVQSTASGDNGNHEDGEQENTNDPDEIRDHEHIDKLEREKIVEFLQEKNKSNAHLRSKK